MAQFEKSHCKCTLSSGSHVAALDEEYVTKYYFFGHFFVSGAAQLPILVQPTLLFAKKYILPQPTDWHFLDKLFTNSVHRDNGVEICQFWSEIGNAPCTRPCLLNLPITPGGLDPEALQFMLSDCHCVRFRHGQEDTLRISIHLKFKDYLKTNLVVGFLGEPNRQLEWWLLQAIFKITCQFQASSLFLIGTINL